MQIDPVVFDRRYYVLAIALAFCVLFEGLSYTYIQDVGSVFYYSSSILYFLSGLGVCLLPLVAINKGDKAIKGVVALSRYLPVFFALFFVFALLYHIGFLNHLYNRFPVDKQWEDMLPAIQVGCRRLLSGSKIYAPTPEMWDDTVFQYLPTMWMPFLPAEIFSFDYRWITLGLQFIGLTFAFAPLIRSKKNIPLIPSLIATTAFFFFINFFLARSINYWVLTEEGVVTGFYLLLSAALLSRNYWLIGLAMTGCTLSRYSLVFWIPAYFGFIFFYRSRTEFWKLALSYGASMSVLFIIPFFIQDPAYFFHIPATYTRYIDRFWLENHVDQHKYLSVGFFKFFTSKLSHSMNIWAAVSSFFAPLILLFWAGRKGRNGINDKYVEYASLKISLIFFYGFISMPYQYVFMPVTLMSFVVLFSYLADGGARAEGAETGHSPSFQQL